DPFLATPGEGPAPRGCMSPAFPCRIPCWFRLGTAESTMNAKPSARGSWVCMLEIAGYSSFSPLALQALPQTSTVQVRNRKWSCDEHPQEVRCKVSSVCESQQEPTFVEA